MVSVDVKHHVYLLTPHPESVPFRSSKEGLDHIVQNRLLIRSGWMAWLGFDPIRLDGLVRFWQDPAGWPG